MLQRNIWFFTLAIILLFGAQSIQSSSFTTGNQPISRINSDPINFSVSFLSTVITNKILRNEVVLFTGVSNVSNSLILINCKVYFTNFNYLLNGTGLILLENASLALINTQVSYYYTSDYYFVKGFGNNTINISNSKFITSPFSDYSLFSFFRSDKIVVEQSNFYNASFNVISAIQCPFVNISENTFNFRTNQYSTSFRFANISDLNVISNTFNFNNSDLLYSSFDDYLMDISNVIHVNLSSNFVNFAKQVFKFNNVLDIIFEYNTLNDFNTGLLFNFSNGNIFVSKNNFILGFNSILMTNSDSFTSINCTLNNFYQINNPIFIIQRNANEKLPSGNVSENFYSNFKNIDFNNNGFMDNPYSTSFFTDAHPLSSPFQNYYILNNELVIESNYRASDLLESQQSFQLFGYQWQILLVFYCLVLLFPFLIFLQSKIRSKMQ